MRRLWTVAGRRKVWAVIGFFAFHLIPNINVIVLYVCAQYAYTSGCQSRSPPFTNILTRFDEGRWPLVTENCPSQKKGCSLASWTIIYQKNPHQSLGENWKFVFWLLTQVPARSREGDVFLSICLVVCRLLQARVIMDWNSLLVWSRFHSGSDTYLYLQVVLRQDWDGGFWSERWSWSMTSHSPWCRPRSHLGSIRKKKLQRKGKQFVSENEV